MNAKPRKLSGRHEWRPYNHDSVGTPFMASAREETDEARLVPTPLSMRERAMGGEHHG